MEPSVVSLQPVQEWGTFGLGRCLREWLLLGPHCHCPEEAPGRALVSPDGRHLLFWWPRACVVAAFQRLEAEEGSRGHLERSWQPSQPPVVGLFVLEGPSCCSWVLGLTWEQGRTELWRFVPSAGWLLLQTLELCHGSRARIVSLGSWGSRLVWCEERPPLEAQRTPQKRAFQYCICTRSLHLLGEQGAQLGPLRVILHNSPPYQVLTSSSAVFLVPTTGTFPAMAKFIVIWRPESATVALAAPSQGCLCTRASHPGGEVDFKKLVLGCMGLLASLDSLAVCGYALFGCDELLLVTQGGTVEMVQPDGAWRLVFNFGGSALIPGEQVQVKAVGSTLACLLGGTLYLVDLDSRQLIEKKTLSIGEVLFLDSSGGEKEEEDMQLLAPSGIYSLDLSGAAKENSPEPSLVEMVFEEACKYYQQRSLSSSQLTVEKLKKGDMFQAPIALSSILCHSLAPKDKKPRALPEPYAKLLGTMQLELQSYQNLELLKARVVGASESEVESYGEALVEQELSRLLHLDSNRENLVYLNAIFSSFSKASWKAIQNHLQLQQNGDGILVARATPDIWKKILGGPLPSLSKQEEGPLNGVLPLFELVCLSLHQFKPKWLPRFVELSQEYMGAAWTYSNKEGPEGCVPLYKRALAVLPQRHRCSVADGEMEIELLLSSQRPKAILQAIALLIRHRRWQRVMEAAEKFSKLSPLLNKEIFIILLGEFAQHRALDPYLDMLWELCPADLSASDVLSIIQQHLAPTELDPSPFPPEGSAQLTVGLLKPLLHKLKQSPSGQAEMYADALQGPTFPPPTPPRQHHIPPKADSLEELSLFESHR
ncbi:LOW QUALITY PROTEIN: Hermansky-Pudlak syndrome 6 protein [Sceloporus undulatus]|uniref:LOW QUALITY PROTEIN: Hermansky-Pudlak syndrome 6 protein n=1 Tax=Sceloporus undulatus TaxID=8520 RepID=UPI001C4CC0AE|nr:LOW QUALITY PROTEIN: Hermansky-Pudlak syndrome 6 protein [Sceloporus undulatus]